MSNQIRIECYLYFGNCLNRFDSTDCRDIDVSIDHQLVFSSACGRKLHIVSSILLLDLYSTEGVLLLLNRFVLESNECQIKVLLFWCKTSLNQHGPPRLVKTLPFCCWYFNIFYAKLWNIKATAWTTFYSQTTT